MRTGRGWIPFDLTRAQETCVRYKQQKHDDYTVSAIFWENHSQTNERSTCLLEAWGLHVSPLSPTWSDKRYSSPNGWLVPRLVTFILFGFLDQERMKGESESSINGPFPMKIIWNLFLVQCHTALAYLRTTPYWSFKMTSCNFRLLTCQQQIKKPSRLGCELKIHFK